MSLLNTISDIIRQKGSLPFVEYMQQALYSPLYGYYTSEIEGLGIGGDFITAPELTPLFAQTLANQLSQVFTYLTNPSLLEFGAGSGRLCVDILRRLNHLDQLPGAYYILEVSGRLKQRQQKLITQEIPEWIDRIHWLEEWPKAPFEGVILANEVLDAMPVHRFLNTENGLLESHVILNNSEPSNKENQLNETFLPCTNPDLLSHVAKVIPQNQFPYLSEANLWTNDWLKQNFAILKRGAVFLIDYGFPQHEYYHPDRNQGTLMCHYQHQAHTDPFIHLGKQDITAHVNFTEIAYAAHRAGFHVAGYTNQAAFLLANGLLNLLEVLPPSEQAQSHQAVKQLLQPHEMGELFKVMALTKEIDIPLTGFQLRDKRASLLCHDT